MTEIFPTQREAILERVNAIDPIKYGTTRNYIQGAVSRLSPYISRGAVSLPFIKENLLSRFSTYQAKPFLQQLAWREYFQRVWWAMGEDIFQDIKHPQPSVSHHQLPKALLEGTTGIKQIDQSIQQLTKTGYLHNHARLYTAMLACNIGRAHWFMPAQWMYYHLLDGDIASNTLSWQWVAGSFSNKKYYANQDNINHYGGLTQSESYLQLGYDQLPQLAIPEALKEITQPIFTTPLPITQKPLLDNTLPLALYTSYQLNPHWRAAENLNRLLILAPSHFNKYPVSAQVIAFVLDLAQNLIPGIQIFVGEVEDIPGIANFPAIYHQQHPLTQDFPGTATPANWMFPEASYRGQGFFGYWKQCEKTLK